ncbi:hypothetical protein HAX54_038001, partial [Datura stramonium]|nr:hypothetical protein [Datura stramonium]
ILDSRPLVLLLVGIRERPLTRYASNKGPEDSHGGTIIAAARSLWQQHCHCSEAQSCKQASFHHVLLNVWSWEEMRWHVKWESDPSARWERGACV